MFRARIHLLGLTLLAATILPALSVGAPPTSGRKSDVPRAAPADEKVVWKKVSSRQGRFEVLLPETPGDQGEEPFFGSGFGTPVKYGQVVEGREDLTHLGYGVRLDFSTLRRSGGRIETTARCWLLTRQMAGKSADDLFKWRRDEGVRNTAGKVLADDAFKVKGGKGRTVLYQWFVGSKEAMRVTDPRSSRFTRTRLIFDGQRLYELSVTGPRPAVTGRDADKFFDSFRLTVK